LGILVYFCPCNLHPLKHLDLNKKVEKIINKQIDKEGYSSQLYLRMAAWAEAEGFNGTSQFLYEEREHMLKLIKFLNERGGNVIIPSVEIGKEKFKTLKEVFSLLLSHELSVTEAINEVVHVCLEEKDYTTHNFIQWYVAEQLEEEALARSILDKLKLVGEDTGGLYLFDRDLENYQINSIANEPIE